MESVEKVTEEISNLFESKKLDDIVDDIKIVVSAINTIEEVAEKTEEISQPIELICNSIINSIKDEED